MGATVRTIVNTAMHNHVIDIECQVTNGLPSMAIVGSASRTIDEARERVRNALNNSRLTFPRKRIAINLAPADIPKTGTSLDLGIAISILAASNQIQQKKIHNYIFIGEVGLNGSIRPTRGLISMLLHGQKLGDFIYVIPDANRTQAEAIPGIIILPIKTIDELLLYLDNVPPLKRTGQITINQEKNIPKVDIQDIVGQEQIKRALQIVAAGEHNILISGAPGTGKSMLARALPGLLPNLTLDEIIEISHLHSLSGENYEGLITRRPFRTPHHSSTYVSMVGGGNHPKPGEITLSHRGVLFLDELPEFSRQTIEAMRQPLEDKKITLSRAKYSVEFPARFTMVATANPCPCGYFGSTKSCSCSANQITQYRQRISGPIADRIDIFVESEHVNHTLLWNTQQRGPRTAGLKSKIMSARTVQHNRYGGTSQCNGSIDDKTFKRIVKIQTSALHLLNEASVKLQISARSYMKIARIAQTIADLEGTSQIIDSHIAEALQYRQRSY